MLIAAQLICFFSLGSNQQTNKNGEQLTAEVRYQENAAAVLLGRKTLV